MEKLSFRRTRLHYLEPGGQIGFGLADEHPLEGKTVDMVFTPELNRWQGHERIQLRVVDLRDAE